MIKSICNWRIRPVCLVNLVLAIATLVLAAHTTFPWCDELVLADNPARWAIGGSFDGRVWPCTYNFLYPALLSIWFKVFGVSHATTISLSVLAAFLTVVALLHIAERRKLFSGALASSAFVILFWCGWDLHQIITNGRLDALTMLMTVLFADALIPDPNRTENRRTILSTALYAGLLMLTSVYMLPLLFVLGLLILIVDPLHDRTTTLRKGLVSAGAIVFSYAFIVFFYFLQHELIRFLGFYIYFNTITGFKADPLPFRILRGYLFNREALVLATSMLVLVLIVRKNLPQMFRFVTVFTLAIPLIMILGGRYEPYYSWAFYLPLALLLATISSASSRTGVAKVFYALLILVSVGFFIRKQSFRWTQAAATREHFADCATFVKAHPDIFRSGNEIVVADDVYGDTAFFYPLLRSGARPWFRGTETLAATSDEEKFDVGLSLLIKDPAKRREVLKTVAQAQNYMPTFPESGYILFPSRDLQNKLAPFLEKSGYITQPIISAPYPLARLMGSQKSK